MKIAVTTPTGHVGSAVVDFLMAFGGNLQVKLLGRRPNQLRSHVQRGVEMAIGSQDDADYLTKATRDVDALFWVTPPGYGSDNVRALQNRMGKAAAAAIHANQIARVINLSSIGADQSSGVGPINGLHDVEQRLDDVASHILHLRPASFFENLLLHVDSIRQRGLISLPISGTLRHPMIATRDIGQRAAESLVRQDWSGHHVQELLGPADLSLEEAAAILSATLERKVSYVRCDRQQARQAIIAHGISENAADLLLEMYDAAEAGRIRATQPRTAQTSTPTTLAEFARDVIAPLLAQPVSH